MKQVKMKATALAAFWAAMIVGSYTAYACCFYLTGDYDVCRRMTPDTVDDSIYSGGWTCVIDPISTDDELVSNAYTLGGDQGYCFIDRTYCAVAYICHNGLQSGVPMQFLYSNPSGGATFSWESCNSQAACPSYNVSFP